MDIGSLIKLHRLKRKMTQEELSEGIVSLSYLSKIENQKANASPEILQLLCDRLGIEISQDTDREIEEKCQEWYGMLFDIYDKTVMRERYEELQQLMKGKINKHTIMFEIHTIRYYTVLRDLGKALHIMNKLHDMVDSFNYEERYYWHKFKGNYYTLKEVHQEALRNYKLAEELIRIANINDKEIANLHYALSITYNYLWKDLEAVDYAKRAMAVFQQNFDYVYCAQCHILLGISYQRVRDRDTAIKNYNLALQLGKLNKNGDIVYLTHYNLGYLYSRIGVSKEAIKHYSLAIETNDLAHKTKLDALTHLVQELYTIGDYEQAKAYLHQANEILELARCKYKDFYNGSYNYIIQVYTCLLYGDSKKFKTILTDDLIPYLKQQGNYSDLAFYAKLLAIHLEGMGHYKESVEYYKLANSSYDQLIKRKPPFKPHI